MQEWCQSVDRYLSFYQAAIMSIPTTIGLLKFDNLTVKLRRHLSILASVIHDNDGLPHGVSLLNHLYSAALNQIDNDAILVLYGILYPCCQVYFNRFLNSWLLNGSVSDPYGEFFVIPNFKYIATRGRSYWTRSYTLRDDIVPDFLSGLEMEVLKCGKSMNLLKLCQPLVNFNKIPEKFVIFFF